MRVSHVTARVLTRCCACRDVVRRCFPWLFLRSELGHELGARLTRPVANRLWHPSHRNMYPANRFSSSSRYFSLSACFFLSVRRSHVAAGELAQDAGAHSREQPGAWTDREDPLQPPGHNTDAGQWSPAGQWHAGGQPYNPPNSPVTFSPDQMNTLRAQIHAFKLLSRDLPVPAAIQRVIRDPSIQIPDLNKLLASQDAGARVVDAAVKVHKAGSEAPQTEAVTPAQGDGISVKIEDPVQGDGKMEILDDDTSLPLYPYNAYLHPFTHLKRLDGETSSSYATRLQRLLVPSIMPSGLDPYQALAERARFIDARIQQRIRELESLPSTIGDGGLEPPLDDSANEQQDEKDDGLKLSGALVHPPATAHGKLRALIELKSLKVLRKQRELRESISERLMHGTMIPLNRTDFRRIRKPTLRDVHTTEQLERKQRVDRERRAKQKHVEQLEVICRHGREVLSVNAAAADRVRRLGRAIQQFHYHAEKEEQKRVERLAKERLKALKADDEEAYMKLIDTAKDTRITHLLKQTDSFLDSLAQAVRAQQSESGGPAIEDMSEETFGASRLGMDELEVDKGKIDYYAVAHRIKENVYQPHILVGGTLKEYQIKGLQWMVSLYNNKLNGILADEMVCSLPCVIYFPNLHYFIGSWKDNSNNLTRHLPY
jgi:ATP-dependent helicase STH1/SNF2